MAPGEGVTLFVPGGSANDQEQAYRELALACGCAPAHLDTEPHAFSQIRFVVNPYSRKGGFPTERSLRVG